MAQQAAPASATTPVPDHDFMPLNGIHHVELYVGNALQAAYYYARAFGFRRIAYRGLETGTRDQVSHVLQQGRFRLVLTGALHSASPIATHQHKHGDGVKDISLRVPSVDRAYREATSRGATGVCEPREVSDEHGAVKVATIETYGETLHTFVEILDYDGPFLPGFQPVEDGTQDSGMLLAIDHIVGNVELGSMERWVKYYEDVFGMTEMIHFSDEDISTEYSALMSKVVSDDEGHLLQIFTKPVGDRPTMFFEVIERHGARGFGDGNFKALFEAIEREQERRGNL